MSKMPIPNDRVLGGYQCLFAGTAHKITTSGTSAVSSAWASTTRVVFVFATTDCYVAFGSNPTATVNDHFLPGGIRVPWGVVPGEKVAVIQSSAAGVLYISEGA